MYLRANQGEGKSNLRYICLDKKQTHNTTREISDKRVIDAVMMTPFWLKVDANANVSLLKGELCEH